MNAIGQDALASLTGNVPKAIIVVRNIFDESYDYDSSDKAAKNMQKSIIDKTKKAMDGALNYKDISAMAKENHFTAMEVQYNPGTLSTRTVSGQQVSYSNGSPGTAGTNMITMSNQPTSTTLSVQLIFDAVNIFDSYMLSAFSGVSSGNIAQGVKNIVSKVKGEEYTVQPQVEALIGLVLTEETRKVMFYWSKMCFMGEINSVTARYTMFNTSGNPVRATVDFELRQSDNADLYDKSYWSNALNNYLESGGGKQSTASKIANNNILNWTV